MGTSIFVKPIYVLTASCLLSSIGSILLAIFGNKSIILLWTGSAMIGLGLASTYASGFLYLKSYLKITNRIGSAMLICGNIAVNVIPIVIGQLIEDHPLVLMYVLAGTTISYSLLFLLAIFTGG